MRSIGIALGLMGLISAALATMAHDNLVILGPSPNDEGFVVSASPSNLRTALAVSGLVAFVAGLSLTVYGTTKLGE